jgi:hypothetical protein
MNEQAPVKFPKRICLDFDGVVHSYKSPWTNPETIEDPPVEGAFQAIEDYLRAGYRVAIFSARSHEMEGVKAMFDWFNKHGLKPEVLDHLEFPTHKPGAVLYIDDRGYHFRGIFPHVSYIEDFIPWNRQ